MEEVKMKCGKFVIRPKQAERLDYLMDKYIKERRVELPPVIKGKVGRPKRGD
jgi:hypothetical protein